MILTVTLLLISMFLPLSLAYGKDYLNLEGADEFNGVHKTDPIKKNSANHRRHRWQLSGLMTVYTSLYYIGLNYSRGDFELDASGQGEYSDWTDFSYDTNYRYFNWGHVYAGMTYYQIARANGLSVMASTFATTLTSAFWEYAVEYREVFSIGDQVLTTFGGLTLGEAMRQTATIFYARNKRGFLTALFDAPSAFNQWQYAASRMDRPKRRYQRFLLTFSNTQIRAAAADEIYTAWQIGIDSYIVNIRDFAEIGSQNRVIRGTSLTELMAYTEFGQGVGLNYYLFAKNAYTGYWRKHLVLAETGKNGYYLLMAPASALEYRSRDYERNRDWHGIVNVMGASFNIGYFYSGWKVGLTWDGYVNFAMVRAYALERYKANDSIAGIRAVVADRYYYYAYGYTQLLAMHLHDGDIEVTAKFTQHYFNSIDNNNRFEQQQTKFLTYEDKYYSYMMNASYRLGQHQIAMGFERILRRGFIDNESQGLSVTDRDSEDRISLRYQYRY